LYGWNNWLDKSAANAQAQAAVTKQIADVQTAANKEIAAQVAQLTAQYTAQSEARDREIASLVDTISSRDAASGRRITEVTAPKTAQAAVDDLTKTYTLLTPVTVSGEGAIVPAADIQQFTVAKIERDTFESDLRDTQTQLTIASAGIVQANTVISGLHTQVDGLNSAIEKNEAKAKAEIAEVKAKARKGKWSLFKWGVVVGFAGRQAIKSTTGF